MEVNMDDKQFDALKIILQQRFEDLIERRGMTNKITYWVGALFIATGAGIINYQDQLSNMRWYFIILAFLISILTYCAIKALLNNFRRYKQIYGEIGNIYQVMKIFELNISENKKVVNDPREIPPYYTYLLHIMAIFSIGLTLIIYLIYKGCNCGHF